VNRAFKGEHCVSENKKNGSRDRWIRPELKRLEAGAAENGQANNPDGGPQGSALS
jgi:hypothetical protein